MNIQLMTSADEVTEDLVHRPSGSSDQENKPFKKKWRIFPVILIIVLLIAIGIGIYYFFIANKTKNLENNDFRTSTSIDNTIYTRVINGNTISKIENDQVSQFAALPENYSCTSLLYNENEDQFYSIGIKNENNISDYAIFSINLDGSVNQKIFHTSLPSSEEISRHYDDFQYIQGNFYALYHDDSNLNAPNTIVKITSEGKMEDFYPIKTSTKDYICYMVANNNSIYCAYANENEEVNLITLENVNGDVQISESSFDSNFLLFYKCNDEYFTYLSMVEDKEKQDTVQKVMKYSFNDKSTEELLSLYCNEYDLQNVFGDYIYYIQKFEDYNQNGISSFPVKLYKYNWKSKETTEILNKVINSADYRAGELTTMVIISVADVTSTGDKILYDVYLYNQNIKNDLYFICNSDGSNDKLLNNRVITD